MVIVGVGLIGGSIGLALRARGLADRVVGLGRDAKRLNEARDLGAIDVGETCPETAFQGAEIAVICTPVSRVAHDARTAMMSGPGSILITDAGSTKRAIVEELERDERTRSAFVGAHPIAGAERSGARYARADLFQGRTCVLTPTARTAPDRLERARSFWASIGSRIVELSPTAHDDALAYTSHLPHAVAAALAAAVPTEYLDFAAGAYRDCTRVAAASPELWSAIFMANRGPLLDALAAYRDQIAQLTDSLLHRDEAAIRGWWEKARIHRERFPAARIVPPDDAP